MIKEILKGWSEQVDNQDVVETFLAKVVDIWNARCEIISKVLLSICAVRLLTASDEDLVGAVLVAQLWCVRLAWLLKRGRQYLFPLSICFTLVHKAYAGTCSSGAG